MLYQLMNSDLEAPLPRALAAGAVVGLVLLIRHGYDVAAQNAYEYVGLATHALDPTLLARDWFTLAALQADVRWASVAALAGVGRVCGLKGASALWFLALALGIALQLFARPLFGASPLPALAAVLLSDASPTCLGSTASGSRS